MLKVVKRQKSDNINVKKNAFTKSTAFSQDRPVGTTEFGIGPRGSYHTVHMHAGARTQASSCLSESFWAPPGPKSAPLAPPCEAPVIARSGPAGRRSRAERRRERGLIPLKSKVLPNRAFCIASSREPACTCTCLESSVRIALQCRCGVARPFLREHRHSIGCYASAGTDRHTRAPPQHSTAQHTTPQRTAHHNIPQHTTI